MDKKYEFFTSKFKNGGSLTLVAYNVHQCDLVPDLSLTKVSDRINPVIVKWNFSLTPSNLPNSLFSVPYCNFDHFTNALFDPRSLYSQMVW